jgi:hypothetical protein
MCVAVVDPYFKKKKKKKKKPLFLRHACTPFSYSEEEDCCGALGGHKQLVQGTVASHWKVTTNQHRATVAERVDGVPIRMGVVVDGVLKLPNLDPDPELTCSISLSFSQPKEQIYAR